MNTDSRRAASAAHHARRKAAGWRRVNVWLSPEAAFRIDALKAATGSADEVIRQAIMSWPGPGSVLKHEGRPIYPDPEPGHTTTLVPADPPSAPPSGVHVEVPVLARKAFNPQPKTGKK